MDISKTIEANSDQLNAVDLITGPVVITVTDVTAGTQEQPINVHSVEYPGRAYRPSKSMRRVLAHAWGVHSSNWVGKRMRLFNNPDITYGAEKVGGIQISHLSDIDKSLTLSLLVRRGRKSLFKVEPLTGVPTVKATMGAVEQATTEAELRALWEVADADIREAIQVKARSLSTSGDKGYGADTGY